ncbi:MAG: cytochrome c oxidase subunit 3, partial [Pseudomonadota bacterium]
MADSHNVDHDYHIIDPSPWPLIGSIGALIMAIGGISYMRALADGEFVLAGIDLANGGPTVLLIGLAIVFYTMFAWWSDTVKESHQGHHTRVVSLHLRYGMILFIASEVMFFVAWFWAFFDASLFPGEVQQVARVEHTGG